MRSLLEQISETDELEMTTYALYLAAQDGIYRSLDAAESWQPFGPRDFSANSLEANRHGDVFAVGSTAIKIGLFGKTESHFGLFVLRAGEEAWQPTKLIDRFDRNSGMQQQATGSLARLFDDVFLAGTGCGVWAVGDRGHTCVQIGPTVDGRPPPVHSLVVSRSHYGEVDPSLHPLILVATFDKMHWCRWGDGARGTMQYWYPPYDSPDGQNSMTLTRLVEYGDSISAWTRYGVYVNWDARGANWRKIDSRGASHGPLLAATRSPDRSRVFAANGSQILAADHVQLEEVAGWRTVWDEDASAKFEFGGAGGTAPPVFSPNWALDHTAYSASSPAGVLKSTDAGFTWRLANSGLHGALNCLQILVSPR